MVKRNAKSHAYKVELVLLPIMLVALFNQPVQAAQCEIKPSSCAFMNDLNVRLNVKKGEDLCVLGFVQTFTGPAGESVFPHPTVHGWKLLKDYQKGRDYWKSKHCK